MRAWTTTQWTSIPTTGETTIVWNSELVALGPGDSSTITFQATVDDTWDDPPDENHTWIVAGDSMSNEVTFDATWEDVIDTGTGTTQTVATAGVTLGKADAHYQGDIKDR